jgi:hypothetical protein
MFRVVNVGKKITNHTIVHHELNLLSLTTSW